MFIYLFGPLPDYSLKLIHVHQRELREEAARLALAHGRRGHIVVTIGAGWQGVAGIVARLLTASTAGRPQQSP